MSRKLSGTYIGDNPQIAVRDSDKDLSYHEGDGGELIIVPLNTDKDLNDWEAANYMLEWFPADLTAKFGDISSNMGSDGDTLYLDMANKRS